MRHLELLSLCVCVTACGPGLVLEPPAPPPPPPAEPAQPPDAGGDANDDAGTPLHEDAGSETVDAGSPVIDAGTIPDAGRTLGVFVATGSVGRTIASFDDGRTWESNREDQGGEICTSSAPPNTCYEGNKTARGVTFFGGHFFVTFDWSQQSGRSNSVRRSSDGRTWTPTLTPGGFGGIAAGAGAVVLAGPSGTTYMLRSTDLGATWQQVQNGYSSWVNFRHAAFVQALGGRFIVGGDGNGFSTHRVVTSRDGASWSIPTTMPAACPTALRLNAGFGSVGDRIVMVGSDGAACRSDDGGLTWQVMPALGRNVTSHD
ncbi:MAG: hypothetical protein JNK82_27535, partial [Myxococcaceae bacterium]|nr:hypothetical protein [Myxococcaceae bacterium]